MNNENNENAKLEEPVIVLTNERTVQINTSSINFNALHNDLDALKMRSTDYIGTSDKNKVAAQLIMNCVSTISSLMYCAAKHEDTDTVGESEPNVPDDDVVPNDSVVQTIMGEPNNK